MQHRQRSRSLGCYHLHNSWECFQWLQPNILFGIRLCATVWEFYPPGPQTEWLRFSLRLQFKGQFTYTCWRSCGRMKFYADISTLKLEIYTSRYYLKIQFLLHSKHTLCPLHRPVCSYSQKNNRSFWKNIRHINKLCGHKAYTVMLKKGVPKYQSDLKKDRTKGIMMERGKKERKT